MGATDTRRAGKADDGALTGKQLNWEDSIVPADGAIAILQYSIESFYRQGLT